MVLTTLHLTTPVNETLKKSYSYQLNFLWYQGKGHTRPAKIYVPPGCTVRASCSSTDPKFNIQHPASSISDPAAAIPIPTSYQPHTIAHLIEVSVVEPTCYLLLLAMLLSNSRTADYISLRQSSKLTKSYHIYPTSFFIHVQII